MRAEIDMNNEVVALEKAYYDKIDWEVQENANIGISYGGFVKFLLDKLLKKESVLLEYLPEKAVKMHFSGDIHIHKLPHSLYLPYSFYGKDVVIARKENRVMLLTLEDLFNIVDGEAEFIEGYEVKEVSEEVYLLDANGWTRLRYVIRHPPKEDYLVSIHLNTGGLLLTTKDHPVLLARKKACCPRCGSEEVLITRTRERYWNMKCKDCGADFRLDKPDSSDLSIKSADEVRIGDFMSSPRARLEIGGKKGDKKLAYVIGYFLGDGYILMRKGKPVSVIMKTKDEENANKLVSYISSTLAKPVVYKYDTQIVAINSVEVAKNFLRFYQNKGRPLSREKRLPFDFLEYGEEFFGALLSGLIDSDGSLESDRWVTRVSIRINSLALLVQLQAILESIGLKTNLRYMKDWKKTGTKVLHGVPIIPHNPMFQLMIYVPKGKENLLSESLKVRSLGIKGGVRKKIKYDMGKVTSIDIIKMDDLRYVYDVETESGTLLVNLIQTHNCTGWSYRKLLLNGLVTPTMVSKPPKHADTAISQLVSFFCTAAQEWTGAQAVSAFDLYLGAFVKHDKPSPKAVKQMLQRMLFDLNYPTRIGFQSAFTNITVLLDTNEQFLEEDAVVSGKIVGKLRDSLDEAILVSKELFKLLIEGDSLGQPFSFPIPTLMITRNFDWDGSKWDGFTDLFFEALSKRGSAYLLNGNAANVESLFSMCCRLTLDVEKVKNFELNSILEDVEEELRKSRGARGLWAVPDATGSIGVVTINLPRIGVLADGDWEMLLSLLDERIDVAREVLKVWRGRYKQSLARGLMPLTRRYLGHFNGHYSTVGLVGLPEAVANFMGNPVLWDNLNKGDVKEAVSLMKKIVSHVRKRVEEFENEDGCLYNVEEVPAESAGTRLALLDREKFLSKFKANEILIPGGDPAPFYSNSVIPYYASVPISLRAQWEGEVQNEFTGGVIMHLFLNESPDPESLKKLARRIVENTNVVYFSFTPSISVCQKCDWHSVGVFDVCPKCGSKRIDVWSRIVGYYRPVRTWNVGKKAEFKNRATYGRESW